MQQLLDRSVADAALGHIDDALEGEVVVRRLHQAQIGDGVADFGAFEEARPADDDIGDLQHDEAFFEGPHLERGADQDRHVGPVSALLFQAFHILGDELRLGGAVPDALDLDLVAALGVGEQGLAQAGGVGADQARAAPRICRVER